MSTVIIPRSELRKEWPLEVRVAQNENDLDEHELDIVAVHRKIDRLTWWAMGLAASTSTATVLLALNLAIR